MNEVMHVRELPSHEDEPNTPANTAPATLVPTYIPTQAGRSTSSLRYVVPNALTLGGLLLGAAVIPVVATGDVITGSWLIIMAVLFDKTDGAAARLLNASTPAPRSACTWTVLPTSWRLD